MTKIDHDENGPFVRAAWRATPEGQTETAYAIPVVFKKGDVEYWNVSHEPHSEQDVTEWRNRVYRDYKTRPVVSVEEVSRQVTISATEWDLLDKH